MQRKQINKIRHFSSSNPLELPNNLSANQNFKLSAELVIDNEIKIDLTIFDQTTNKVTYYYAAIKATQLQQKEDDLIILYGSINQIYEQYFEKTMNTMLFQGPQIGLKYFLVGSMGSQYKYKMIKRKQSKQQSVNHNKSSHPSEQYQSGQQSSNNATSQHHSFDKFLKRLIGVVTTRPSEKVLDTIFSFILIICVIFCI